MTTQNFPLVSFTPVANAKHDWVALALVFEPSDAVYDSTAMSRLFGDFGLLEALGPLSCILPVSDVARIDDDFADQLPTKQVILHVAAQHCSDPAAQEKLQQLQSRGFRILVSGMPPQNAQACAGAQGVSVHCGAGVPSAAAGLKKLSGSHLALNVANPASLDQCIAAGFSWFSGEYLLRFAPPNKNKAGQSRTLLLKLLSLVARDAETRELESLLKQDPGLSFQLFKLVNSVAFSRSSKIESFSQAIALLGRRQLQRWLQLLLYAQQQGNSANNPLLPLAAMRANLMETLCQKTGGSREEQDHAYMVGMFSLLEALFGVPLAGIVKELNLSEDMRVALLERKGRLSALLLLSEQASCMNGRLQPDTLAACGIGAEDYCRCLMQACQWAIQVSQGN